MTARELLEISSVLYLYLGAGLAIYQLASVKFGASLHWLFIPLIVMGWPIVLLHVLLEKP